MKMKMVTGYTVRELAKELMPLYSNLYEGREICAGDVIYEILLDGKVILFLVLPNEYGKPELYSRRSDVAKMYPQMMDFIQSQRWMTEREDENVDQSHNYVIAGNKLLGYLVVNVCYDNSRTFFHFTEEEITNDGIDGRHLPFIHIQDNYFCYPESLYVKMQTFMDNFCLSCPSISGNGKLLHNESTEILESYAKKEIVN